MAMRLIKRRQLLLLITCVLLLAGLMVGCAESKPEPAARALINLKSTWKERAEGCRGSKGFWSPAVKILTSLLKTLPSHALTNEIERICRTEVRNIQDLEDLEGSFDEALLEALIQRSVEERNTAILERLLKSNCPKYVAYLPLEFYLGSDWPDGFVVLFDCAEKSITPHAKENLTIVLRRAFSTLSNEWSDRETFIRAARSWHSKNRENVELNEHYPHLMAQPVSDLIAGKDRDLFLMKHRNP